MSDRSTGTLLTGLEKLLVEKKVVLSLESGVRRLKDVNNHTKNRTCLVSSVLCLSCWDPKTTVPIRNFCTLSFTGPWVQRRVTFPEIRVETGVGTSRNSTSVILFCGCGQSRGVSACEVCILPFFVRGKVLSCWTSQSVYLSLFHSVRH